jgi:hypothetical protein
LAGGEFGTRIFTIVGVRDAQRCDQDQKRGDPHLLAIMVEVGAGTR